ncbi:hypothetical protein [Sphaerisporangium sp. TRM90804]|uniref:hypothetical protein n=1 Tax=Sphaerisporangium sp. TRM90804 TaxID=3031113 RepID=UPI002447797A|nr:hypothetical protein [Sphaerisporangium sp. TRM90804]MDH2424724.1 hypothetical protein [Sphaerisporangium sp. TRM90804]
MSDYRKGIEDDVGDLARAQASQFSAGQKRAPLTKASAGWELPNRTTPSPPPSGGQIYGKDDEPYWRGADGSDYSLAPQEIPEVPVADSVSELGGMAADGDIGGTPNANNYNALRADVQANRNKINQIIEALTDSGLMAG